MATPALRSVESPRPGQGLRRRMLVRRDGPALEFLEGRPEGAARGAPLLLLHGAFGGAWMWSEAFMPALVRRGRAVAAVSLRGHGGSGGHEDLRTAGLSSYLADVRRAFEEFEEPPVVVAHSLGGLLAQALLGRVEMRALALLASLPPEGLMWEGPRFALTDPLIWWEAFVGSVADMKPPIATATAQLLLGEGVPPERLARYAGLVTPEAPRVLAEAHLPPPIASAALCGVPSLVVGGGADRLVGPISAIRTALYHGAAYRAAPGLGHFMMLDPGSETALRLLLEWLEERGL